MRKIAILLIALMVVSVGFLSGCNRPETTSNEDNINTGNDNYTPEYTTFEVEQLDVFWVANFDTMTDEEWMEISVINKGNVTTNDVFITIELEKSNGVIVVDKTVKTLEMKPNEVFSGRIDLQIDYVWIDFEYLNSLTTISYEKPDGNHDEIKISNILLKNPEASEVLPLYSLEP